MEIDDTFNILSTFAQENFTVNAESLVPTKKMLIIGATGNWGGHFAIGMALATQANLVLVDYQGQETMMNLIVEDIKNYGLSLEVETYMMTPDEIIDREVFYKKMKTKFGPIDAIMDVEGINLVK